jgi:hypothetical protein
MCLAHRILESAGYVKQTEIVGDYLIHSLGATSLGPGSMFSQSRSELHAGSPSRSDVVINVDTHKDTHTAAVGATDAVLEHPTFRRSGWLPSTDRLRAAP